LPTQTLFPARFRTVWLTAVLLWAWGLVPCARAEGMPADKTTVAQASASRRLAVPVDLQQCQPDALAPAGQAATFLPGPAQPGLAALHHWPIITWRPLALVSPTSPRAVPDWFRQQLLAAALSPNAP
jgi:hypothetical protein